MIIPNKDRVLVVADMNAKNLYQLTDDITIEMRRDEENFNCREKNAVQAVVAVDYEELMNGDEVLLHHNSLDPSNEVFHHDLPAGTSERVFAVPKEEVYCYRRYESHPTAAAKFLSAWKPCNGFLIVERVWRPYSGLLYGIAPTQIENVSFVLEGSSKHKAVHTGKWTDYEVIYQDGNGKTKSIIRMRDADENWDEVLAISDDLTDKVLNGDLLIGLTATTAKKFELYLTDKK